MFTSFIHKHLVISDLDQQILYILHALRKSLEYLWRILLEFHALTSIAIRTATITTSSRLISPLDDNSSMWHDVI
jgi:hypothetical protein